MPVTIKTNKIWIKNANGTYTSFDAMSDGTTDERIADINDAADNAIDRIDEAKATIPTSYSQMSQDVATLKDSCVSITNATIEGIVNS